MTTAEQILVVILSVTLAIFLILSIIAAVKIIRILKHVERIMDKAENIADKAESITGFFQKTAGPMAVGKLIANIVDSMKKRTNKEKD